MRKNLFRGIHNQSTIRSIGGHIDSGEGRSPKAQKSRPTHCLLRPFEGGIARDKIVGGERKGVAVEGIIKGNHVFRGVFVYEHHFLDPVHFFVAIVVGCIAHRDGTGTEVQQRVGELGGGASVAV